MEPIYLEPAPARLTEYGKRWTHNTLSFGARHQDVLADIAKLGRHEIPKWDDMLARLRCEGVLTAAISSGISQTQMVALINASTRQATYTAPAAFVVALMNAAPSSTTTGVLGALEATYVGYARTIATMTTASAATPSVAQNTGSISFPACTGAGATLLGFICADSATTNTGNALWYGTLTSTAIASGQTPTLAGGAIALSLTGT